MSANSIFDTASNLDTMIYHTWTLFVILLFILTTCYCASLCLRNQNSNNELLIPLKQLVCLSKQNFLYNISLYVALNI